MGIIFNSIDEFTNDEIAREKIITECEKNNKCDKCQKSHENMIQLLLNVCGDMNNQVNFEKKKLILDTQRIINAIFDAYIEQLDQKIEKKEL